MKYKFFQEKEDFFHFYLSPFYFMIDIKYNYEN